MAWRRVLSQAARNQSAYAIYNELAAPSPLRSLRSNISAGVTLRNLHERYYSSYFGSLSRSARDLGSPSEASLLKEIYRSDPERVIQIFEGQPSLHSNPSALSEYVKALVKVDRLDESILLKTLQRGFSLKNSRWYMIKSSPSNPLTMRECHKVFPSLIRPSASYSTQASDKKTQKERKDLSTTEDPFDDAPTYNIPEKPVTFAEGASYSLVILAGLGVAALAGYAVFKELIFEPKEYKIFGKALARVQSDSQVTARIGYPITGYGSETRNRAARQRVPSRIWTDEEGVEHVEVNFYIRGPHGAGKVYSAMFKDNSDGAWKFTYLLVEFTAPHQGQVMLESYIPA
ncbi:probable mitochondrial import inner membrane translocase subunit TIM21 isoform X1 [Brachypodium distachyon]|uniref:Mitochondrial import inner membrane translocase subunit Tim21 n=1 Tax=Brachypodium distachyon TaxID=15368 RepID=I1HNS3_BRADI|nr:probable mitochondrial import inner membrane translocase subunit TIM21 isoform X1 [Brachypodium distachyon]KQK08386.1 hypothetical protein BRADI_2g41600v3 [Brachypodium distachyon]|eukprot:XP_003569239.1 probable mitochondrial import inner membrane translocase subunit TIM21 isoform X1 [Brachypodium distachyon]